ncbi:hypothetical protein SAMN02745150_01049 [Brevinema andersonii]|uniref:Uncharacterized protein n=1 Tax=Brevinema andersonii TaxID=34097 RepID=A0A1I1EIJ5_BREAD|nr:hypothetical protein [Brevinema andersonii]SFB84773.1 hypothetical protein SAMN02745150_01049 [Brevinema andersonii]
MSESHKCECQNGNTIQKVLNKIIAEDPGISVEELMAKAREFNSCASSHQQKIKDKYYE